MKYPVYMPFLGEDERENVINCIESTWISSKGKYIELFERRFAEFIGVKNATSVNNGTSALHTALLALGIKEGDEVIVPTLTYIASVNSIKYTGATPVFVDSKKETWNIDESKLREKITPKTKAIMPVHLYGNVCEMNRIKEIAEKNRIYVIEDCAEAIGSKYDGQKVGTFGDVACFSFFGNKTITTGEGGMVITNNEKLRMKIQSIKGQGLSKEKEYWHDIIGYNYRMTNLCAAIGCAQLRKINEIISKKIKIANWYKEKLKNLPISFQKDTKNSKNTYWMFSILVDDPKDKEPLRDYLKKEGIETRPLFNPIHLMKMYPGTRGDFPVAENLSSRGINLPSYPDLNERDIDFISEKIRGYYG